MRNKVFIIMKKNFIDNFSILKTSLYIILMLIVSYLLIFNSRYFNSKYSFLDVQYNLISQYFIIGFFIIVGIPYLLYLILLSAGAISKEIEDGTFLLVFSRPIKRIDVLLGKFLGIFSYLTLINGYILFTLPSLGALFFGLPRDTLFLLYGVSGVLFLYGILITIFMLAMAFVFSSKFKKIVLISVALFIIVLGIFIVPAVTNSGVASMKASSNIFSSLGIDILEGSGLNLNYNSKMILGIFTGAYDMSRESSILYTDVNLLSPSRIKTMPLALSVFLMFFFSFMFFLLAYIFIRKREIY